MTTPYGIQRDRLADEQAFAGRLGRSPTSLGRPAVGLLAVAQGGCVARWQLRWLGFADTTISRWVTREGWDRVHAGVWRLPGVHDDHLSTVWAAVLALSDRDGPAIADARLTPDADPLTVVSQVAAHRVVVTGLTAGWLQGIWADPPRHPHLLLERGHTIERDGVCVTRSGLDRFHDARRVAGLWVAGGPRMAWDTAWAQRRVNGALTRLVDLLIRADRTRVMSVDDVIAVVDEPSQFRLPLRVPALLRAAAEELRPGFSHSATEALGRRIAGEVGTDLGLEVHPRPYPVKHAGRIVGEADIAVLSLRHDLEIDGPHHELLRQKARDRRRDGEMAEITWAVTRYPVAMLDEDERRYAVKVRRDLQARIDALG